jgi:hypothetical protein
MKMHMSHGRNRWVHGVKVAVFVIAGAAVFAFVLMALWNWLVPPIIGWKAIDYWQAIGLFVLAKILFGFPKHGGGGRWHWKARMAERWERMTPEEREKYVEGMRHHRCGKAAPPAGEART